MAKRTSSRSLAADQHQGSAAQTKAGAVISMLQREQGATLTEMVDATGWQPHTTRAALTGLRRKGHAIERRKRDDVTCYYLSAQEA